MSSEMEEFVALGVARYKQATRVMVSFGKEVESQLKTVLENRKAWGQFNPTNEVRAKSTTYWSEYPLLNAKLVGELRGAKVAVVLAVNWYQSDTDYPLYCVFLEPHQPYLESLAEFEWNPPFELNERSLRFYPDPDDFNLIRDANRLLDEFTRFLEGLNRSA